MSDETILLAIALALSAVLVFVLVFVMNDRQRLKKQAESLEASLEVLNDRLWEQTESSESHKALLNSQGDVIIRLNAEGIVSYANPMAGLVLGMAEEALVGAPLDPVLLAALIPDAENGLPDDVLVQTAEGPRWMSFSHHRLRDDDGRLADRLIVGRDMTARKQAEAALAEVGEKAESASRAKSRFLATVSHEIRTPMNGIMGMAALLADTEVTPEQKSYVEAIRVSGDNLLNLIDDILDFSKIEAGRLDLDHAPFDIVPLVEGVAELLAPRAHLKGLEIACGVAPHVPRRLMGDATRLRQVLLNLAGNAVKFTDQGGVSLTVDMQAEELVIAVRDTGPGIPDADQERIFAEFEQGEATLDRRHAGTGLGLSISRKIVRGMGGSLAVSSKMGAGATFTIRVKLEIAADCPQDRDRLDGLSVLIVSRSIVDMPVMARRLMARGAHVRRAEKIEDIGEEPAETVIIDKTLSDEEIMATLARVKPFRPRIVLTVLPTNRKAIARWREKGVTGWLIAPVREVSLLAQVRPLAGRSKPDHAHEDGNDALAENGRSLAILLAEDNDINALLARRVMEKNGHTVTWVKNGREAVDSLLAEDAAFDLVLMDMQMPEMDGLSATRAIRASESKRTPIVALTANSFVEDREAALAAGMDAFVTKPIDQNRLNETIALLVWNEMAATAAEDFSADDQRASALL